MNPPMPDRPTCSRPGCRNWSLLARDTCGLHTPRGGPVEVLIKVEGQNPITKRMVMMK